MNARQGETLDQSRVVHLGDREQGGPAVAMTPPDAPGILLREGRPAYSDERRARFSWKPTIILTSLAVAAMLALAVL